MPTPLLNEPLDFEIREGNMHVRHPGSDWEMATPLRHFRVNMARAKKVLDEHDARSAEVVPLRPRARRRKP